MLNIPKQIPIGVFTAGSTALIYKAIVEPNQLSMFGSHHMHVLEQHRALSKTRALAVSYLLAKLSHLTLPPF